LHLVAGVLDDEQEYLGDFLPDIKKISQLAKEIKYIYIYHSTDDPLVPYSHAERLAQALPQATLLTFEDRGHFRQTDFPELLANITAT
jgi:predicted alpha/beta hydrolase family esterase